MFPVKKYIFVPTPVLIFLWERSGLNILKRQQMVPLEEMKGVNAQRQLCQDVGNGCRATSTVCSLFFSSFDPRDLLHEQAISVLPFTFHNLWK